jgi:hypothetical protein
LAELQRGLEPPRKRVWGWLVGLAICAIAAYVALYATAWAHEGWDFHGLQLSIGLSMAAGIFTSGVLLAR